MNSFLNPHNGTSLTGVVDLTAHSISLFQENESPQNTKDTFMNKNNTSIAGPYDVQIDELGIILFRCISLFEILMTQKWLDQNHYSII